MAFLSFLGFTTLQLVFAMVAHSQSMMTDCAAMYVDVLSYMVNFLAERLKHGTSCKNLRDLRLHRLYLELVPPLISVAFLVAVTAIALQKACEVLLQLDDEQDDETEKSSPDLALMLLFSGLNLVLDVVNVSCFARVDQAVGIPGQRAEENIHVHIEREDPEHPVEYTHLIPKKDGGDDDTSEHSDEEHQGLNLNMCSGTTNEQASLEETFSKMGSFLTRVVFLCVFRTIFVHPYLVLMISFLTVILFHPSYFLPQITQPGR